MVRPLVLALVLGTAGLPAATAAPSDPPPNRLPAHRTLISYYGATPTLDGQISAGEWEDAFQFSGVQAWTAEFSPVTNDADLSLIGRVKHDQEHLYFAFDVADDVLYGLDTERWLPPENPAAHELTPAGFPWFGDEIEILVNAPNSWIGNESVEGNGASWQLVCNLTKSRLGGVGIGGLLEGEPRTDPAAWNTYQRWIQESAQRAVAKPKPSGKGYVIEWAVRFDPCLEIAPGRFYRSDSGIATVGINIALGDLDRPENGSTNFGKFHHEQWLSGARHTRTQKNNFGSLILLGKQSKPSSRPLLQAGAAAIDISPTNYPVIVNAMFTERTATNTVDPLASRALVLDDGSTRLALAVVDTCMMPRDLIDRAKQAAAAATSIPAHRILISATHTHSAPSAMGCLGSRVDPAYAAWLPDRIAASIILASDQLAPARIGWGATNDWDHTHNRRWIRRPDRRLNDPFGQPSVRAHMHPGHQSPDAVGPSGPVDPGLSLIALQSLDGRPLAVLANYSQHYYGSPLLSSDYFGRLELHLARLLGVSTRTPAFIALMSQGTSGDLMWMDYAAPPNDIGYDAYARAIAKNLLDVYRSIQWQDTTSLQAAHSILPLRYRTPDADRLAWARSFAASIEGRLPRTHPEIYALEALHLHERQHTELVLQALRIGSVGITAIPNEVYAITGLKLKAQSPLPFTFNISLANGAEGYIPPPEQHLLGGYTTWPARTAGLETQAEPRIVATLLTLLETVADQPRRPLADAHGPYARAVLASKPRAYWRLNDIAPPLARDASDNKLDARIEDGVAVYLPGADHRIGFHPAAPPTPNPFSNHQINRAAHIAGGKIVASLPPTGPSYSLELWIWNGLPVTNRPITGHLFSLLAAEHPARSVDSLSICGTADAQNAGKLQLRSGSAPIAIATGSNTLGFRRWHHIVVVRNREHLAVHLDGNPQPETGLSLKPETWNHPTLLLGARPDEDSNLEGRLDEVAFYDRALNPAEIQAHFRQASISPH